MTSDDLDRLARNEKRIMDGQNINRIRDIPSFCYTSLSELREAKLSGKIKLTIGEGVMLQPDLFWAFATRGEIFAYIFWTAWPVIIGIAYIVTALISGKFLLLWGLVALGLGFFLSKPSTWGRVNPLVGIAGILCVILAFTNPVWAFIIAGIDAGYVFIATATLHTHMILMQRALASEVLFCYAYSNRIILVFDQNGKEINFAERIGQ